MRWLRETESITLIKLDAGEKELEGARVINNS